MRTVETTTSLDFTCQCGSCEDQATNFWQRAKEPANLFLWFAPRGWVYLWTAHLGKGFQKLAEIFGGIRVVLIPSQVSQATSWWRGREAIPLLAFNQTMVNQTRLACALERYHLIHNEYPESLDVSRHDSSGRFRAISLGGNRCTIAARPMETSCSTQSVGTNRRWWTSRFARGSPGKPEKRGLGVDESCDAELSSPNENLARHRASS